MDWYCPVDGTILERRIKCDQERYCPVCVKVWAYGEAVRAAGRLDRVSRKHRLKYEPRHVVVSGPQEVPVRTAAQYDALFRESWRVLRKMGVTGGALVIHPWRHRTENGVVCWYDGPHVHAIVWGHVDAPERPDGWVVKTVQARQNTIVGTIAYLLDHCGVVERKHSLRYYGVASFRKSPGCSLPERKGAPRCPKCGGEMERVQLMPGGEILAMNEVKWRDRG